MNDHSNVALSSSQPTRNQPHPPHRLHPCPSLRSLSLSNLPAFLSPFPLPSHLSTVLHSLCLKEDSTLSSLVADLQRGCVDVDTWERAVWLRVTAELQPRFDEVFKGVDMEEVEAGVWKERSERGWAKELSLTFGEVPFSSLACILARHVPLHVNETFVDLGSGLGRGVVAALLSHSFSSLIGIELLHSLHRTASLALAPHITRTLSSTQPPPAIQLINTDFLSTSVWLCADVVFVNSTAFDGALMRALSEKCEGLRLGSRVITLTHPLTSTHFIAKEVGSSPMSWGQAEAWVHIKCRPPLRYLNGIQGTL